MKHLDKKVGATKGKKLAFRSIGMIIEEALPELVDMDDCSLLEKVESAVYRFCLGLLDGRQFNTALREVTPHLLGESSEQTTKMRDLRSDVAYSYYSGAIFWRAYTLYVNGFDLAEILASYPVYRGDILRCSQLLSDSDRAEYTKRSAYASIRGLSEEDYQWLVAKAEKVAKSVAHRKLRFIGKYDPSFDGASDLLMEAIRIIHHYSHYSSKEHIFGSINLSLPREAERIREFMQAAQRRPVMTNPNFRCPSCKQEWEHRRNKGLLEVRDVILRGGRMSRDNGTYGSLFCEKCLNAGNTVKVDVLDNEREYTQVCVPLAHTNSEGEEHVTDHPDENAIMGDEAFGHSEFVNSITTKLDPEYVKFLHVFLDGSDEFDAWMTQRKVNKEPAVTVRAALVAEFLGLKWSAIKEKIGTILRPPQAYLVEVGVGEPDGSKEVVFAMDPSIAVQYVAKTYRFRDGKAMQEACGRIRVRPYNRSTDVDLSSTIAEEGRIIPCDWI